MYILVHLYQCFKMEKSKRINFTQAELDGVRRLVVKYPIIEKKLHDQKTETLKQNAWQAVMDEFNAECIYTRRTIKQLKGAWKRVKYAYKSQKASERRSKFKTGGGPPSPTTSQDHKTLTSFW